MHLDLRKLGGSTIYLRVTSKTDQETIYTSRITDLDCHGKQTFFHAALRGKPDRALPATLPRSPPVLRTAAGGGQRAQRLHSPHEGHALQLTVQEVASLRQRLHLPPPDQAKRRHERGDGARGGIVRACDRLWGPERTTNSRRSLSTVCRLMLCSCVLTLKPCKDAKHGG